MKKLLPALLALSGLALNEKASAQTPVFVQFPMTANNMPINVSPGVTVATPLLHKYVLSNGTANAGTAALAAYSVKGQAFAVAADGTGFSTAASSPKGVYYEQFAITATAPLRVDSLIFNERTQLSAGGRLALLYSLNGFATDSTEFSFAKGPTTAVAAGSTTPASPGGPLPAAHNGTFGMVTGRTSAALNYAYLPQDNALNPKDDYHFAFNNTATGLTLTAGQTLTVRLYFGIGSNTAGRYIELRNVTFKSRQPYVPMFLVLANRSIVQTNLGVYPNPTQNQVLVPHAVGSQDARVTVYNTVGAQVASVVAKAGTSETTVSLEALAKGLYLVEYTNGQERSSARVVKE